jgi:hypothetical protein
VKRSRLVAQTGPRLQQARPVRPGELCASADRAPPADPRDLEVARDGSLPRVPREQVPSAEADAADPRGLRWEESTTATNVGVVLHISLLSCCPSPLTARPRLPAQSLADPLVSDRLPATPVVEHVSAAAGQKPRRGHLGPKIRGDGWRLPQLSLADALGLTMLIARKDPSRYPRVAARWLSRFLEEHPEATIEEAALAASCLIALPNAGYGEAAQTHKAMAETATRRRRERGPA